MNLWSLVVRTRTRSSCPVHCAHCGLPTPAPYFRQGCEDGLAFCCRACRQVYDLVRELSAAEAMSEEKPAARAG